MPDLISRLTSSELNDAFEKFKLTQNDINESITKKSLDSVGLALVVVCVRVYRVYLYVVCAGAEPSPPESKVPRRRRRPNASYSSFATVYRESSI